MEKDSVSLRDMLRLLLTNKMFLIFLLSSFLMMQSFASSFVIFPLYTEEKEIAKYHVSICYVYCH